MTTGSENLNDPAAMFNQWAETMTALMSNMTDTWMAPVSGISGSAQSGGRKYNMAETMGHAVKNWQAISKAMLTADAFGSLSKGVGAMPEFLSELGQSSAAGMIGFQQKIIEQLGRMGKTTEAYRFEDLDENIFRVWSEIYEREFRRFFQVPQLGLLREYQERMNKAADHANRFQVTYSEFLRLLVLPINRSLAVMQEEIGKMAEAGELRDDAQFYYDMWVKILEGHYMNLFKTDDYMQALSNTVTSLTEFAAARNAVLEDMVAFLPVVKQSEMDDLTREMYRLKKKIRQLEKRLPETP